MSESLYRKPAGVRTVWANPENPTGEKGGAAKVWGGRKGAPCMRNFKPGETRVLAEAAGCGIVRRIWITTEKRDKPQTLKGYRLECFWDGCDKAAVSVPLGDFFCFNSTKMSAYENAFFSSPEGRSFNCVIPMPFQNGMKITISNDTPSIEEVQFFYQVDYTLEDDVAGALYFHAFYNREQSTAARRDYTILPQVKGCGRYLGASFGVIANPLMGNSWWGEGEVKCYIDGDDAYPTLAGTGTEDYIGTGWGQGRFANRYQGCLYASEEEKRFSFYRFHGPDPVFFDEDIRVTIQQIGCSEHVDIVKMLDNGLEVSDTGGTPIGYDCPGAIFERFDDDWCSVAYFYLDAPASSLPELPPYDERISRYQGRLERD